MCHRTPIWYHWSIYFKRVVVPSGQDMYVLVSPEIGGDWPGSPDGSTVWPMELELDYVRAYRPSS